MHRIAALLAVLAAASSLAACGRAGENGVREGIDELASISAEGALMAGDVARGRSKTTFVRVHGAELSAQAEHEAEKLNDDPLAPGLAKPVHSAIALAADIGAAIDALRVTPQDRRQARVEEARLTRYAGQAAALAEPL
jgi:hypothetical protein